MKLPLKDQLFLLFVSIEFILFKEINKKNFFFWLKNVFSDNTHFSDIILFAIHSTVIWLFVSVQSRIHGRVSFCYADKKRGRWLKKREVVKRLILSYVFIKAMYEFDSRFFCGNLKNRSKAGELLRKRIQMYW